MKTVDNASFDNSDYSPGRGFLVRTIWYFVNVLFFKSYLFPFYTIKTFILRLFGATVGDGLVIKPHVNIKYPWHLYIGDNVWIGEGVWIDNLTKVIVGSNVCISQGAFILTGNHNYLLTSFDLIVKEVILEDGVWLGAKSIVCPGTVCETHSVLSVGSVATVNLKAWDVYSGVPAVKVRQRKIK